MNVRKLRNMGRSLLVAGAFLATTVPSIAEAKLPQNVVNVMPASVSLAATSTNAGTLRDDMNSYFDTMRPIVVARGLTGALASIDEAQNKLASVSDAELAELFERAGAGIPDVSVARSSAHDALQSLSQPKPAVKHNGRSHADFPQPESIFCAGEPDDATLFALMITKQVTASILHAAEFACQTTLAGFNAAPGCIPFAILADVADIAYESATWCADQAAGTRVEATFERTEYLHNQLTDAQEQIQTQISAMQDLMLKLSIEQQLAANQKTTFSSLPAIHGGQLELVAQIATEAFNNAVAAGVNVPNNTAAILQAGHNEYNAGEWSKAFSKYQQVYKNSLP